MWGVFWGACCWVKEVDRGGSWAVTNFLRRDSTYVFAFLMSPFMVERGFAPLGVPSKESASSTIRVDFPGEFGTPRLSLIWCCAFLVFLISLRCLTKVWVSSRWSWSGVFKGGD